MPAAASITPVLGWFVLRDVIAGPGLLIPLALVDRPDPPLTLPPADFSVRGAPVGGEVSRIISLMHD